MDGKVAGMYDLDETLGSGHFAVVKLARHVFTGERVAVKVIDKLRLDKISRDHLFQEVRCMKLVQHPGVIRLYQVIDTQTKLYLILELGEGGDLYEYIQKHEHGVGETEARDIFRQIVEAIAYCHRLHVVHRDLKPENVVFCENGSSVKLTDFGLSNKFAPGEKLTTSCGSLSYSAPEILLGDHYDAPAVDVWGLGVILFMLLVGEKPFNGGTDSETLTMIMDCKFGLPDHLSTDSKDLVRKMLVNESSERISVQGILDHLWMKQGNHSLQSTTEPLLRDADQITPELHSNIVQRMVAGNFADAETVQRALKTKTYDHIAATYYLMVEAHLRQLRQGQVSPENLIQRRRMMRKLSQPVFSPECLMKQSAEMRKRSVKESQLSPFQEHLPMINILSPTQITKRVGAAESGVLKRRRHTVSTPRPRVALQTLSHRPRPVQLDLGMGSSSPGTRTQATSRTLFTVACSPVTDTSNASYEDLKLTPPHQFSSPTKVLTKNLQAFVEEQERSSCCNIRESISLSSSPCGTMYPNWLTVSGHRRRAISECAPERSSPPPANLEGGLINSLIDGLTTPPPSTPTATTNENYLHLKAVPAEDQPSSSPPERRKLPLKLSSSEPPSGNKVTSPQNQLLESLKAEHGVAVLLRSSSNP